MSKIMLKIATGLITTLFISCFSFSVFAANKIVSIGNAFTHQGLLASLGVEYNPAILSYTLANGYIIEIENDLNGLNGRTQQQDVLAVVCQTSSNCAPALEESAAKDLLIIAVTASSTLLSEGHNIWRMAPSNKLQAKAIYAEMKAEIGQERFAVVYEPENYGLDLYVTVMGDYATNTVSQTAGPELVGAIPLHDNINLDASQKSVKADTVKTLLGRFADTGVQAVAYLGFDDGFKALTDESVGGNPDVVEYWYTGDGVHASSVKAFPNLRLVEPYYPSNSDEHVPANYYYAYDTGTLLLKTIAKLAESGLGTDPERTAFMAIAKTIQLTADEAKTGQKAFTTAEQQGVFTVHVYDSLGSPQLKQVTINAH